MSAPTELKKKFDEIFEALKYTKAIENINKLKKGQGDQLKQLKIHEETAKVEKDRGEQVCHLK